jgi:hypothetical protein
MGTNAREIPEALLRREVFVKANHGSSFNHRISGQPGERDALAKTAATWLATAYGRGSGEWPYLKVHRRIFVEEAVGLKGTELMEFNLRAANGRVLLGSVMGRVKTPAEWCFYLDVAGRPTWGMSDLPGTAITPLPPGLDIAGPYHRAVEYTQRLSRGIDYARFDFLWNGRQLFGGEITLFPAGGNDDPTHPHADRLMREGWDLLQSHFLKTPPRGLKKIYVKSLRRRLAIRRG